MSGAAMNVAATNAAATSEAVTNQGSANSGNGFRYRLDVRFFEVDSLGVVFNMWYLGWCDEAMSAFMESIGHGYATLRASGFDAVLRKAELEWVDSLEAFQQAEITVRVDQVGTTSFRLRYSIDRVTERVDISGRQGARCAEAAITYVCVQIADRAAAKIPSGLREALVADCG